MCSFTYLDTTNDPKVASASLTNKQISFTLSKVLSLDVKNVKLYLGNYYCIPDNMTTVNLSCNLDSTIVGTYTPTLITEYGKLANDAAVTDITIDMIITAISPASVNKHYIVLATLL